MTVYALVIDNPQTLPDISRRCENLLKAFEIPLFSFSDIELAFQTVAEKKQGGEYPLTFILGSGLEQPLSLSRRLHNDAPLAHFFFLAKGPAPELLQQLKSPVAGLGKHWSILDTALDNLIPEIQKAIFSARQRYQFRTALQGVNRKLAQKPTQRNHVTQRYSVSLRFLSNIFEYAHDAIIATTLDGAIVRWNKAAELMFGLTANQAVGTPIADISRGEWSAQVPGMIESLLNSEVSYREYELACEREDNKKFYIGLMLSIVQSETGKSIGISAVIRDITERKHTEEALTQLRQELEQLSFYDGLTGIANRRMFDKSLQNEWNRALRKQQSLTLIMLDIDHFKEFNDCYGHQMGDVCLKQVADALTTVCKRSTDLIARYGGEEFAILLPETGFTNAVSLAHACNTAVSDLGIPHKLSKTKGVVTISVGVTSITPSINGQVAELIESADRLLYKAKETGRNQVISDPAES